MKEQILCKQDGFVLILCMLMMVVLSIIGLSASTNTRIELQIAGNERIYVRNFYQAEAAAYEVGQRIFNEKDPDFLIAADNSPNQWLKKIELKTDFLTDELNWEDTLGFLKGGISTLVPDARVSKAAFDNDKMGGSSGSLGESLKTNSNNSVMHEYVALGRSQINNGSKIIEVGFRKRFK